MSMHVSKSNHAAHHHIKTNIAKQVILLGLSFILMTAAIVFISLFAVNKIYLAIINSEVGLLFNSDPETEYIASDPVGDTSISIDIEDIKLDDDENKLDTNKFPVLQWGDEWATLTIPGYKKAQNVPVYVGDNDEVLRQGVGKYYGSVFPGEIGNVVLSAHVNRWFYDLQDLPIGQQIILNTVWGEYVYEVEETFIFDADNPAILLENDGTERLLCYTCHPRGIAYRSQRYAVICKKVSGGEWQ